MTRPFLAALLVALAASGCASGYGRSYYGFAVDISNAPPPPSIALDTEPTTVLVPGTDVYEVDNDLGYDMFRYGPTWYVSYDSYWYSAPSYRGPFTLIRARSVPRRIYDVPVSRWHHHPEDRQAHRERGARDRDRGDRDRDDRDRDDRHDEHRNGN